MENQLFELARKRRSIRQYGNKRIDDDVIAEIMKVALTAPTSFEHHAVEFVVVREAEMIRKVGACKNFGGSQVNGADTVIVAIVKTSENQDCQHHGLIKICLNITIRMFLGHFDV